MPHHAPIGVFDSGIGGLSVLQALRAEMPAEQFIYLADTGNAPYGERGDAFVMRRTQTLARYLVQQHGVKAMVIACNTATAAAIDQVRQRFPHLPVVGVEPAVKPAAMASRTGHIAVMATRGTATSSRFAKLVASMPHGVQCRVQACDGLASAIEAELAQDDPSTLVDGGARALHGRTLELCSQYLAALGPFGSEAGAADTLVLGCTHYVFAQAFIQDVIGTKVQIFSTGGPVALQTQRLLAARGQLATAQSSDLVGGVRLLSTGDGNSLAQAAQRWLGIKTEVRRLSAR